MSRETQLTMVAVVLMVAVVAFAGGGTGMFHVTRAQFTKTGGPGYTLGTQYLSEGLRVGETFAAESAETCTEEMKWACG